MHSGKRHRQKKKRREEWCLEEGQKVLKLEARKERWLQLKNPVNHFHPPAAARNASGRTWPENPAPSLRQRRTGKVWRLSGRYQHQGEASKSLSTIRKPMFVLNSSEKQVEVREKQLTPSEALEFHKAKETEVKNFIASGCFVGQGCGSWWASYCGYEVAFNMETWRVFWGRQEGQSTILFWATKIQNMKTYRTTSAPTPSRSGRQLFWQLCSWKRFRLKKGDISGAFLQGDDMEEELWCRPVKEITVALGLPEHTPMLMCKAAYGLVQAPLQWFYTINNFLGNLGYKQLQTEPCCWVWVDAEGQVRSIVHSHVDDLMFGGQEDDSIHHGLLEQLQARFKWGSWEDRCFVQCGIEVVQNGVLHWPQAK